MKLDSLGSRMKRYEDSTNFKIIHRAPIMVRLDGRSFSRLSKRLRLNKPYDESFSTWMAETTKRVTDEVQGCVLGYTQSDEITLVIRSDQSIYTVPWFDNRIQKMVSIISGVAAATFNSLISCPKGTNLPVFDCRIWPMPNTTEVINDLVWRQQDCIKNSISGACYYGVGALTGKGTARKLMDGLDQAQRVKLLHDKAGIEWHQYPDKFKYGIVVFKENVTVETENGLVERKKWVHLAAPIFVAGGWSWLDEILTREEIDGQEEKKV